MIEIKKYRQVNPDTLAPELKYEVVFTIEAMPCDNSFEGEQAHDVVTLHRLLDKMSTES